MREILEFCIKPFIYLYVLDINFIMMHIGAWCYLKTILFQKLEQLNKEFDEKVEKLKEQYKKPDSKSSTTPNLLSVNSAVSSGSVSPDSTPANGTLSKSDSSPVSGEVAHAESSETKMEDCGNICVREEPPTPEDAPEDEESSKQGDEDTASSQVKEEATESAPADVDAGSTADEPSSEVVQEEDQVTKL